MKPRRQDNKAGGMAADSPTRERVQVIESKRVAGYDAVVLSLYESPQRPLVVSFMAGMGGEAIVLKEFYWMTEKMLEAQKRGKIEKRTHWVGFEE